MFLAKSARWFTGWFLVLFVSATAYSDPPPMPAPVRLPKNGSDLPAPPQAETPAKPMAAAVLAEEMRTNAAYLRYAEILIHLDLLADPDTSYLPVTVSIAAPGVATLNGTVPNERVKRYVIANAKRLTGLTVRDAMKLGNVNREKPVNLTSSEIREQIRESIDTLFAPEVGKQVRVAVDADGTAVITGKVTDYETKLQLSQTVKSQPGITTVASLLEVPGSGQEKMTDVSSDGSMKLALSLLPPVGPPVALEAGKDDDVPNAVGAAGILADDAPEINLLDRQIREDAEAQLARNGGFAEEQVTVSVQQGVLHLTGKLRVREQVEAAVDAVTDVPKVTKIVAKFPAYTYQRNRPEKKNASPKEKDDAKKESKSPRKLLGVWPFSSGDSGTETSMATNRRFRDNIRRTLKSRCGDRAGKWETRDQKDALVLETTVKSNLDRTFVMKQVDNLAELRSVPYDVIVRVQESTKP